MLDGGEWIIKVMQEFLPLLILWRLAETNRVILKFLPMDQQHIFGRRLNTALQLVPGVTRRRGNNGLGLREGAFERGALSRPHMQ